MARYWVNLGEWETDFMDEGSEELEDLREKHADAGDAMSILATSVNNFGGYVYKTNDREDAEEVAEKARKALVEIFGENNPLATCMIDVTRQPECPECGELGRFSDSYCPRCGSELVR